MAKLISLAGGCGVTLHRAFDVCRDPFAALETAKRLGVDTILTSGQQADCTAGADLLRALVAKAGEDVQILVGAGVKRRCYPRFAAENRRKCVPFIREACRKQQNAVSARKCADGAARTERIQFVAVRRKCSPCGA